MFLLFPRSKVFEENVFFFLGFVLGIMFRDITTLLLDHKAFKDAVDIFIDRYKDMGISVVAGILSSLHFLLFKFIVAESISNCEFLLVLL